MRNDNKKKTRNKKCQKKGAAIVLNQPELVGDQPGRRSRNETL